MPAREIHKVRNIQALRACAALLVLWAHTVFVITKTDPTLGVTSPQFFHTPIGAVGVDIFFVISGYVISLTACSKDYSARDFWLARIARIAPLYFALSVPVLIVDRLSPDPHIWQSVWTNFLYFPLFDFDRFNGTVLGPGWSLSFEMWFYCAFACLLLAMKPVRASFVLPLVLFVGALAASFYRGSWFLPHFLFNPITIEFGLGCLLFQLQHRINFAMAMGCLAAAALLFIGEVPFHPELGLHLIVLSQVDLSWQRACYWGLPAALLVSGFVALERTKGFTLPSVLVWMGDISYSLYLIQPLTIRLSAFLAHLFHLRILIVIFCFFILLSISLGWLCWRFVEKPLGIAAKKILRIQRDPKPRQKIAQASS